MTITVVSRSLLWRTACVSQLFNIDAYKTHYFKACCKWCFCVQFYLLGMWSFPQSHRSIGELNVKEHCPFCQKFVDGWRKSMSGGDFSCWSLCLTFLQCCDTVGRVTRNASVINLYQLSQKFPVPQQVEKEDRNQLALVHVGSGDIPGGYYNKQSLEIMGIIGRDMHMVMPLVTWPLISVSACCQWL